MGISFKITLNIYIYSNLSNCLSLFDIEIKYFIKLPYLFITIILFLFYQLYLNLVVQYLL